MCVAVLNWSCQGPRPDTCRKLAEIDIVPCPTPPLRHQAKMEMEKAFL